MKPSIGLPFLIAALFTASMAGQISPQFHFPPPPPDPKDLRIAMDVDNVILDVSVKDRQGQWVSSLEQSHFSVTENGTRQKITWFSKEDIPVTLGIVLDNSGSMRPKRARAVTAALAFAKTSNPHDEMFAVTFNHKVQFG